MREECCKECGKKNGGKKSAGRIMIGEECGESAGRVF